MMLVFYIIFIMFVLGKSILNDNGACTCYFLLGSRETSCSVSLPVMFCSMCRQPSISIVFRFHIKLQCSGDRNGTSLPRMLLQLSSKRRVQYNAFVSLFLINFQGRYDNLITMFSERIMKFCSSFNFSKL